MCDQLGMKERTLTIGSASKMFSLTGWRVGWAHGPASLMDGVKLVHSYASYCAPTPLQLGVQEGLEACLAGDINPANASDYNKLFLANAILLSTALSTLGVSSTLPQGGYFLVVDVSATGKSDVEFCTWLATEKKVTAVPMQVFYADNTTGKWFLVV